jgi:hypothetical protein
MSEVVLAETGGALTTCVSMRLTLDLESRECADPIQCSGLLRASDRLLARHR